MTGGWRVALRIARREVWRAKGRSALVMALIALPVFALSYAAVTYDSLRLTTEQQLDHDIGTADAKVSWETGGLVAQSPDGIGIQLVDGLNRPAVSAADLARVLPPGSRLVPLRRDPLELRTAAGIGTLLAEQADLTDPIHRGRISLRDGRAPAPGGEVAVTREAGRRLGAGIGDQVYSSDGSTSWTVVGIFEYPERFQPALIFHPSTPDSVPAINWLVDTPAPVTWDQVRALNRIGIVVVSRAVQLDPPPVDQIHPLSRGLDSQLNQDTLMVGLLIGGLALLEVVLLAGPAFAVGARRRQRELALVAAGGGSPAHQRRIVLADGVVLGLAGAVAGVALGTLVAIAALPLAEELLVNRRGGGVRLWPAALAAIGGLAVVIGLLAALVPAAVAARQDVVAALAGRRGVVRSRRRWLVLGLAMTGLGAVVAVAGAYRIDAEIALTGLVACELGLVLSTPALVGLVARAGPILPLALRIAVRDTARNRAAAAPAISAVMAAVAGSVALGMYVTSSDDRWQYAPSLPLGYAHVPYEMWNGEGLVMLPASERESVRSAIAELLPADRVVEVVGPACGRDTGNGGECQLSVPIPPRHECPYRAISGQRALTAAEQRAALADSRCRGRQWVSGSYLGVVVDDGTLLPVLTGVSGEDAAAAAATLRAGGVVVNDPRLLAAGMATVEVRRSIDAAAPARRLEVPGYALPGHAETGSFTLFVAPEVIAAAGLESRPAAAVGVTSRTPTVAEQDRLAAALTRINPNLWVNVEREYSDDNTTIVLLTITAGVITLGAAGIATGLAAAERRGDISTLGAVGASPRVRRLLSLSQSGVVAGLGALLGSAVGIGAAATVMIATNRQLAGRWPEEPPYPLVFPWQTLAVVLVAVPAIAMLGAGLLTRSRIPIERRLT